MADVNKIVEAKEKVQELINIQSRVDAGIARMPEGADKERLKKMRDDNRGFFSNTIVPAWKKLQSILSEDTELPKPGEKVWYNPMTWFAGNDNGLGLVPLVPVAAVVAATAVLGFVVNSIVVENRILSDPSFTSAQKTTLLQTGGISKITEAIGQTKWIVLLAALGAGAYLFRDELKGLMKKSNPVRRDKFSKKISQLVREGYPQKQAAAIAYSEKRRGKL